MVKKTVSHFSLEQICDSGQCFRMEKLGEGAFLVLAGNRGLRIRQEGETLEFDCTEEEFLDFWEDYFDLKTDYGAFLERIDPRDRYLCEAARRGWGIRILRQDLWEMLISFLISQQNHIARIRRCIGNICERYGKAACAEKELEPGEKLYGFPSPDALAQASEEELRDCNLGYRAKYVSRAAKAVAEGNCSLEKIKTMSYPEAKAALLELYGVGEKVADCICLFGLHHLEAFPVDTHIRQALEAHYRRGFPKRKYRGIEGVLQQYIFYYELTGR